MGTYAKVEKDTYPVLLLVPSLDDIKGIDKHYLSSFGEEDVIVGELYMRGKKAPKMIDLNAYIQDQIAPLVDKVRPNYVVVAQGDYFKKLSGQVKTDANVGYVFENIGLHNPSGANCAINVAYVPSHKRAFYDPDRIEPMIERSLGAVINHANGVYLPPGDSGTTVVVKDNQSVLEAMDYLIDQKALAIDTETFSLNIERAKLGTIACATDTDFSISMPVSSLFGADEEYTKRELKAFFEDYRGKVIYHNASYDISVLIRYLFMDDIADVKGMMEGLECLTRDFEDTKIIAYLATNTCAGNNLGLKDLAQEFAGNFAEDEIKDITRMPLDKLLEYNAVDTRSTWYVYNTYYPLMESEGQLDIYENHFKKYLVDIIQMQLTGIPLNMGRVKEVKKILTVDQHRAEHQIKNHHLVQDFHQVLVQKWVDEKNATWKKKRTTVAESQDKVEFNPASSLQLGSLLFEFLELPVLELTPTKLPATGNKVLKNLKNHTDDPDILRLLDSILDLTAVSKIVSAFIPAFEAAAYSTRNHWHYLIGHFNLGGTVSGRLSGSNPNLQQLPSGGRYGSLIKSCFQAPKGKLLIGLDFDSLEDKISALTTKDPNKVKVYSDGYDGHSFRAYSYYPEVLGHLPNNVEGINSIKKLYPTWRDESKAPTFALTYQGTYLTLMKNCGFSEEKAKIIEERFLELYRVSVEWVNSKLKEASKTGYILGAFGLKIRTPLLKQTIQGTRSTPTEASAEGRTAGNALGQSWCLLNNRAQAEFLSLVRASEFKYDIRPCAAIHDATYYEVPEDLAAVQYVNTHLVREVNWNDHPEIYHPEVGLGGKLSVFYPSWEHEITIPNDATTDEIETVCNEALKEFYENH